VRTGEIRACLFQKAAAIRSALTDVITTVGAACEQQNANGLPIDPNDGIMDAALQSAEWVALRQLHEQSRRFFEYS
jgi:hypothetical protein